MNIGVIGYGVVGRATAEVLRRLGHRVRVADTDCERMRAALSEGHGSLRRNGKLDILFLCVPEGSLRLVLASAPDSAITVVRSTVVPGTSDDLAAEFGRPLAYMPETLREATALWDALNPSFIIIGCRDQEHGQTLAQLFEPLLIPVVLVAPATAEMVKLTLNAHLHTLVSFWNEIYLICTRAGIESHVVGKLCSQDPRVATYGAVMHGQPVGGRCLPKDMAQLVAFARDHGYAPDLLEAVRDVNHKVVEHTNGVIEPAQFAFDRRYGQLAGSSADGAGRRR